MNVVSKNKPLRSSERGATMVEYSLMASLIGILVIGALSFLGQQSGATFVEAGTELARASGGNPPPPPPPPN